MSMFHQLCGVKIFLVSRVNVLSLISRVSPPLISILKYLKTSIRSA